MPLKKRLANKIRIYVGFDDDKQQITMSKYNFLSTKSKCRIITL